MPDETPEVERLRSWCSTLEEANSAWQAENAKLRELVVDMYSIIRKNNSWWDCKFADSTLMRSRCAELGIEVDE